MPRAGPRKVQRYSLEFKLKAVKLSQLKGVEVPAVADALEIHPFMLSRWRKEARDGVLRGRVSVPKAVKTPPGRDIKRFQALKRAHALLQEEQALLKSHPVLFRTTGDVFAFIDRERARFGVTRLCRCYGVTRAGFYAWRQRPASRHQEQDRVLLTAITAIFTESRGTYGSPRVHRALRQRGQRVSRRRVERLMRAGGLRGRVARVYRRKAGTHRWFGQHPNHVRWTRATRPNPIWVGDLTYLRVARRWWYLATVLDQSSRRVLAWRLETVRDARLTGAVVQAALRRRRPTVGLIFHSDRGSEYLGAAFRHHLAARGVPQRMTRGGAPGENTHIESFFHSFKADVVPGCRFQTIGELRRQLRWYLPYYNPQRLHSALGHQSPVDYERRAA